METGAVIGDNRNRHADQREFLPNPLPVLPDEEPLLPIFFGIEFPDPAVETGADPPADLLRPRRNRDEHEIVAADMAQKILHLSALPELGHQQQGNLLDHLASPCIAVMIDKGLEIVQVHMAERNRFFCPKAITELPLDRQVPRKTGQRTRIEVPLLENLEALGHDGEGMG